MKKELRIASLALLGIIATTGLPQAAEQGIIASSNTAPVTNYVITWKNQFASNASCSLNASAVSLAGTIQNNIQHSFTGLGQTVQVTLSSLGCTRISLSATCKYKNAQGHASSNSFGSVSEPCSNYVVTLNPTTPGSLSISPDSGKKPSDM